MSLVRLPWRADERQLRAFAALLAVVGAGLAARAGLGGGPLAAVALWGLAGLVGVTGVLRPGAIRGLYLLWLAAVSPIAWLVSHLLLLVLYFGVLTPVALLLRLSGRDELRLRRRPAGESQWRPRRPPASAESYYRQS